MKRRGTSPDPLLSVYPWQHLEATAVAESCFCLYQCIKEPNEPIHRLWGEMEDVDSASNPWELWPVTTAEMSNHDPPQPWEEPHRIGKEPAKDIGVVKGVPISIHIKNGHGSKWLTSRIGCLTFPKKGQTGRAIGVSPWEIPQFMAMFDRTNLWRKNWYSTISLGHYIHLHPIFDFFRNISSFSPWKWHSPHNRRPPRIHRPRSPPASAPGGRSAAVAGGAKAAPGEGPESWSSPDAPCGWCGCLVGGWPMLTYPSEKWWKTRQLGWWHSQNMGK